MIIFQDTREQTPLPFKLDETLKEVKVKTLDIGDYACELPNGKLCPVRFERKSIGDLYNTMTIKYKRFQKEMRKCEQRKIMMMLIIEASFSEVAKGYKYSKFKGRSMIRKLMTLFVRYDLYPIFCNSPDESAAWIKCFYESFGKDLKEKNLSGKDLGGKRANLAEEMWEFI